MTSRTKAFTLRIGQVVGLCTIIIGLVGWGVRVELIAADASVGMKENNLSIRQLEQEEAGHDVKLDLLMQQIKDANAKLDLILQHRLGVQ